MTFGIECAYNADLTEVGMDIFEINGGKPLCGSAAVQGSKNSVLPILAASLLGDGCEIENCPALSDVDVALRILRRLGCSAEFKNGVATVAPTGREAVDIPDGLMREMRSSVIFLGAVLARSGEAEIYFPGGCRLGPRPIDMHLDALEKLGVEIETDGGRISCRAHKLRGAQINFDSVSVGATENAMLAAVLAEGETLISNAAREPEIVDLQNFLNKMGACVSGAGSNVIHIKGVRRLHGARHSVIPDRIAAATVLSAAAACGGNVELGRCRPDHMETVLKSLHEMGCELEIKPDSVALKRRGRLKAPRPIVTAAYPGFPTDAQPLLMAAGLTAEGSSVFVENIFENRYAQVPELRRMGADIITSGRVAAVVGVERLIGAEVEAADLRGGAALLIAAMSAEGYSRVAGAKHIDRGYECPEELFGSLGAKIKRKEVKDSERQQKEQTQER